MNVIFTLNYHEKTINSCVRFIFIFGSSTRSKFTRIKRHFIFGLGSRYLYHISPTNKVCKSLNLSLKHLIHHLNVSASCFWIRFKIIKLKIDQIIPRSRCLLTWKSRIKMRFNNEIDIKICWKASDAKISSCANIIYSKSRKKTKNKEKYQHP